MMISAGHGFINQSDKYSKDNAGNSLKKYILLKENELAYNHGASKTSKYGCCYILNEHEARIPYVYHCFSLLEIVNSKYIELYLNTSIVEKQLGKLITSTARMDGLLNISYDDYMSIKISLPPKEEQEKIADFISLIDQKIEKQKKLVELLKKYKKGVMSSHFTKVERDKTATKILLSNDCLFFSGGTPKSTEKSFYEGEIPFIRSGEIHKDKTELFINELALKNSSAKMVKKGDLLLAMYGATSGEVSISQINGAINQAVLCIRPRNINTYYLKNILEYNKNKIISTYIQGGQGNLSAEIIKNLSFKIPAEKEQNIFNSYISQIDIIIEKNSKKIEFIRKYKKGLLQQLFI